MASVENRGPAGSGHGWSGASIVYWNSEVKIEEHIYDLRSARMKVEAAPGTLSWSIGTLGLRESFTQHSCSDHHPLPVHLVLRPVRDGMGAGPA